MKAEAKHDRILRRPEAAHRLGVGVKALDLWKRRGVLEPVTIPGSSVPLGSGSLMSRPLSRVTATELRLR